MEGRGLEALLQAVAQVPEAILVMLGEGPLGPCLKDLGRELKIEERLHLPGKVPWRDLLRYTRDASIGVVLTQRTCLNHYYSLPNKLFEYLMAGVPVIASDFPDIRGIIQEAQAGLVVGPDNPQEIADALRLLLSDPEGLRAMSRRARAAAETKFNWALESKALLAVYDGQALKRRS